MNLNTLDIIIIYIENIEKEELLLTWLWLHLGL